MEAMVLQEEIVQLISKVGFDLRKWNNNCPTLVNSIPQKHKQQPIYFQKID